MPGSVVSGTSYTLSVDAKYVRHSINAGQNSLLKNIYLQPY